MPLSTPVVNDAAMKVASKEIFEHEAISTAIHSALHYLDSNPRKIKRFINMFRLVALIANSRNLIEKGQIDLEVLARFLCLTTRWPELGRQLLRGPQFARTLLHADELKILGGAPSVLMPDQRAQLDALLAEPLIKQYLNSRLLIELLKSLKVYLRPEAMLPYLHLTETVERTRAEKAPVSARKSA
jgi:hypothetical protein